ncbi:hypothetical protein ACET3Z_019349 [Daucus carota]
MDQFFKKAHQNEQKGPYKKQSAAVLSSGKKCIFSSISMTMVTKFTLPGKKIHLGCPQNLLIQLAFPQMTNTQDREFF